MPPGYSGSLVYWSKSLKRLREGRRHHTAEPEAESRA
jgi:hypothetical protein